MGDNEAVTVTVRKGTRVHVVESDSPTHDDPRVPKDRDIIVSAPARLKIAIAETTSAAAPTARTALVMRCG